MERIFTRYISDLLPYLFMERLWMLVLIIIMEIVLTMFLSMSMFIAILVILG